MNDQEHELFAAELRRLKPARLPDDFESRLDAALPAPARELETRRFAQVRRFHGLRWQWLAPAAAVAVAVLVFRSQLNRGRNSTPLATPAAAQILKADQVEIDRQLLGSFDAVANLPDGEPVRFRFQQWMDAVTLRDSVRGVEVVQRTPRIEVVPVSFATY